MDTLSLVFQITSTALTCGIFITGYFEYRNLSFPFDKSLFPVISMILLCEYWATYGWYCELNSVILVNVFGLFCGLYYFYLCAKVAPNVMFFVRGGLSFILYIAGMILIFNFVEGFEGRKFWLGIISSVMSVAFFASPMSKIFKVLSEKDGSHIPFALTIANLCATIMWTSYALMIMDFFIMVPNFLGTILSGMSLFLHVYFKKKKKNLKVNFLENISKEMEANV